MAKEVQERLDILGGLRVAAGAGAGKVLTSDASGNAAWAALSGSSAAVPTAARVHRATATTPAGNAASKIAFDVVDADPGGNYSLTNTRYVCPTAGYYLVEINIVTTAAASMSCSIFKNGVHVSDSPTPNAEFGCNIADIISCQAGDYIEGYVYVNQAGSVTLRNDTPATLNYMSIVQVGGPLFAALPPQGTPTIARAWRSATDTVVGNAVSKIPFDTISYDPGGNYSIASGRYVCPTTGYYLIHINLTATAAASLQAILYKNGAQVTAGSLESSAYGTGVADIIFCQAGDYFEGYLYVNGAGNVSLNVTKQDFNFMAVAQIGGQNMVAGLSPTAQSAAYTASAGQMVLMTGNNAVTLPSAPIAGGQVGVMALTTQVTINRGGTDTINREGETGKTSIVIQPGTRIVLMYLGGVWYVIVSSVRSSRPTAARATATGKTAVVGGASNSKLALDTKTYDSGSNFDTANNRYVAPVSGYYQVNAEIVTSATVSQLVVSLYKNGASYQQGPNHVNSSSGAEAMSDLIFLAAGDYVELWYYVGAGGAVSISGTMTAVLMENA